MNVEEDEDKIVDEPWDDITAKYWPQIKEGSMTILEAYEKEKK